MKVKQLSEVVWKVFQNGRPKATAQTMSQKDIGQMVMLCYGNAIRKKYLESIKNDKFREPDYSFVSPVLSVKEFSLSEANTAGMRSAMVDFDLYRLPYNGHITNVYPIGGSCGSTELGTINPIRNGEEKYYSNPKFVGVMQFYVPVGRNFNFYNLPLCVDKVGIETTYNSDDVEITLDIGFEVSLAVFQILWKEKLFPVKILDNPYDPNAVDIKHRLQEQQQNG